MYWKTTLCKCDGVWWVFLLQRRFAFINRLGWRPFKDTNNVKFWTTLWWIFKSEFSTTSHGTSLKKKRENDRKKKYLLNYKSNEFKQKSTEETLPWGVTAQGINASRKLHGRGMIVCKQKENNNKQTKRQNNWIQCYRQTGDRCVNMLCRVSKGISFFSSLFFFCSFFFFCS